MQDYKKNQSQFSLRNNKHIIINQSPVVIKGGGMQNTQVNCIKKNKIEKMKKFIKDRIDKIDNKNKIIFIYNYLDN